MEKTVDEENTVERRQGRAVETMEDKRQDEEQTSSSCRYLSDGTGETNAVLCVIGRVNAVSADPAVRGNQLRMRQKQGNRMDRSETWTREGFEA